MRQIIVSISMAALLLSGCVTHSIQDGTVMNVGEKKYMISSTSATGHCTEVTTAYLWSEDGGRLLDKETSAGSTLLCSAFAGAVAGGAIAGGLASQEGDRINSGSNADAKADAKAKASSSSSSSSSSYSTSGKKYRPSY